MRRHGKKFAAARQQVPERPHTIEDAIPLIQKVKFAKFDETVEIALRLGVDPKHADQMVRGTVVLPHGLGRSKRVLAIAGGEKQKEAQGRVSREARAGAARALHSVARQSRRPVGKSRGVCKDGEARAAGDVPPRTRSLSGSGLQAERL